MCIRFLGTYFYHAAMEGLLKNDTNIHAGIRTTLSGMSDYENDGYVGFEIVEAREIDTIGTAGIIKKIHDRVGKCSDCNVRIVSR
jgi:agmatinase